MNTLQLTYPSSSYSTQTSFAVPPASTPQWPTSCVCLNTGIFFSAFVVRLWKSTKSVAGRSSVGRLSFPRVVIPKDKYTSALSVRQPLTIGTLILSGGDSPGYGRAAPVPGICLATISRTRGESQTDAPLNTSRSRCDIRSRSHPTFCDVIPPVSLIFHHLPVPPAALVGTKPYARLLRGRHDSPRETQICLVLFSTKKRPVKHLTHPAFHIQPSAASDHLQKPQPSHRHRHLLLAKQVLSTHSATAGLSAQEG